jgi:N6-adenosine-specific RNA methylase IME4/ParB-like chromosome segregation protein Spo0J
MTLKSHPLANVLPLLEGAEFDRLVDDIAKHGLLNPVTLFEGKILDGRNRERACDAARIEPRYVEYDGNDPAAFVLSQNLARRHLGPSERAMVAARMATLKWGQHRAEGQICLSDAAKLVNVSERSIKHARVVLEHGAPELVQAVEQGRVAVHEAAQAAKQPSEAQADFLAAAGAGKSYIAWSTDRRRKDIATTLGEKSEALPIGKKRWPLLLADPPWQFEEEGLATPNRRTENHFPTMRFDEICALPVADLAAETAILFLWTTTSHLAESLVVMDRWGFKYQSNLVWIKPSIGTGYWVRGRHEHLLIGTRGDFPHAPTAQRPDSVIAAPRRNHSRKPDEAYELIERMYPDLPKIELFARHARPGWDAWGNEAPTQNKSIGD